MPPDATATKARILRTAFDEFAAFGLAGARVDRIAELGQVNKRSIYVHFGNKEELFDIVVSDALKRLAADVEFTAEDLPGYAARLLDHLCAHPGVLRLTTWANLERPAASQAESETYRAKIGALSEAQRRGRLPREVDPVDLLTLVTAMTTAWATASPALLGLQDDGPDGPAPATLAASRRALLIESVQRLVSPAVGQG